jgi:hypothetical protein
MRSISIIVLMGLLAAAAAGQVTFTASIGMPPGVPEISYLPTAAHPLGLSPSPTTGALLPMAAGLPPLAGNLAGGMASDDRNGWIYTSNGQLITMDMNPHFLPFGATLPPPVGGPLPVPSPYATGFVNVTGLAFDDQNGILWACDQANFWGMNPLPPFNPIVFPQPIPALGPPAVGLGFESSTGTLWACDVQGGIYHFTPGGAPFGAQPVAFTATVGAPLGGLAVATHNGPGALPAPACSTQIPGYHITVTDGIQLYDALNLAPPIALGASPTAAGAYGHTYSSDFQVTRCDNAVTPFPSASTCSSGLVPLTGLQAPAITGPGAFNGIRLVNAPPVANAILLVDTCPQLPCWYGLMMNPFTWTAVPTVTDAAGNAGFGFFAGGFPAGFQFSHQWAIQDPGSPLGYCFSNLSTETIGLP